MAFCAADGANRRQFSRRSDSASRGSWLSPCCCCAAAFLPCPRWAVCLWSGAVPIASHGPSATSFVTGRLDTASSRSQANDEPSALPAPPRNDVEFVWALDFHGADPRKSRTLPRFLEHRHYLQSGGVVGLESHSNQYLARSGGRDVWRLFLIKASPRLARRPHQSAWNRRGFHFRPLIRSKTGPFPLRSR